MSKTKPESENQPAKRVIVSQSEFPNLPLDQVLRLPQALWDNFAGKGAAPLRVAMALGVTPTSGPWRNLCGTAIAYGLTEGGYNASEIKLTPLGLQIVRPTKDDDVERGITEAITKPRILREFLHKYNNAKFPKDIIAQNVLVDLGLPKARAAAALEILKDNAEHARVLADIKGEKFVFMEGTGASTPKALPAQEDDSADSDAPGEEMPGFNKSLGLDTDEKSLASGKPIKPAVAELGRVDKG